MTGDARAWPETIQRQPRLPADRWAAGGVSLSGRDRTWPDRCGVSAAEETRRGRSWPGLLDRGQDQSRRESCQRRRQRPRETHPRRLARDTGRGQLRLLQHILEFPGARIRGPRRQIPLPDQARPRGGQEDAPARPPRPRQLAFP